MLKLSKMSMFAYVKFTSDSKCEIVPSRFIKGFESDQQLDTRKKYEVFWSPCDEDTPEGIEERQGHVLNIDSIKNPKQKKAMIGKPGFYFANVLIVGDSKEKLEEDVSNKAARKLVAVKGSPLKSHDSQQNAPSKAKIDEARKKGEKESLKRLSLEEPNWRDKYLKKKAKMEALKKENTILRDLNIRLQRQFLEKEELNPGSSASKENFLEPLPMNQESSQQDPLITPQAPPHQAPAAEKQVITCSEQGLSSPSGTEFLTEEQKILCLRGVQMSSKGDGLHAKNLAMAAFGREVLMTHSIVGKCCPSNKSSVVKPALCPLKLEYIRGIFKERIMMEGGLSTEDILKRMAKFNRYISEKMMGLIRFNTKKD